MFVDTSSDFHTIAVGIVTQTVWAAIAALAIFVWTLVRRGTSLPTPDPPVQPTSIGTIDYIVRLASIAYVFGLFTLLPGIFYAISVFHGIGPPDPHDYALYAVTLLSITIAVAAVFVRGIRSPDRFGVISYLETQGARLLFLVLNDAAAAIALVVLVFFLEARVLENIPFTRHTPPHWASRASAKLIWLMMILHFYWAVGRVYFGKGLPSSAEKMAEFEAKLRPKMRRPPTGNAPPMRTPE